MDECHCPDPSLALFELSVRRPALIILDLMMTPLTGLQFLDEKRHREGIRDVPVLILSAWDLSPEERERYKNDIAGIIRKPVLPKALLEIVTETLRSDVPVQAGAG